MRRIVASIACLLAALIVSGAPAPAVTNGALDGTAHPNVGFIVATAKADECGAITIGCTGFMISSSHFLTTGGCAQAFLSAPSVPFLWVTFTEGEPLSCATFIPVNQIIVNPGFGVDPAAADLAVLVLGTPPMGVTIPAPVALPEEGSVAAIPDDQKFTVVAYGAEAEAGAGGGPMDFGAIFRRFSPAQSQAVGPELQFLLLRTGSGPNPACFGPFTEAGASFIESTNDGTSIVLLDPWPHGCPPRWSAQRLDTPSARGFLDDFVALP